MRRTVAIVLFSTIVILSFDFTVARIPFVNRDRLRALFERQADTSWYPEYPAFLEDVRAHTQPGDSIALFVPAMHWDGGYSYAYYRASYFLSGREVLPLVTRQDKPVLDNFKRAKFIAVWQKRVSDDTRHVVWSGHHGVLLGH